MSSLLYISNQRMPTEKAYGIQIAKMCEAFALQYNPNLQIYPNAPNNRIEVELVIPHRKNSIKEDIFEYYGVKRNFRVVRLFSPDFYLPGKLDKLAFLIKNFLSAKMLFFYVLFQKADIIFSRDELPLYFLSFFKNNLIFEAHKFSSRRFRFYRRFKKLDLKIVTISKGLKDEFIKFGFNPKNIIVAHDGVDLNKFNLDITREEARRRTNLPPDKKIIMYTGHLFDWKGVYVLAEAADLLSDSLVVFIGGTDSDITDFKNRFKDKENVLILGQKEHREIPFFLKAADVLVLPNSGKELISRSYTSPLKLFEYMASGRPIVASALPSIKEILNKDNSVLVESDSTTSLAEGIRKVLNDKDLARKISEKAFEDVKDFTWAKRTDKILNFIILKICYLTNNIDQKNGWGRYAHDLISGVRAAGHEAVVLKEIDDGLEGAVVLKRGPGMFLSAIKIRKYLKDCDVVHALDGYPYGIVAALSNIRLNKKLIISGVGTYSVEPLFNPKTSFLLRWAYKKADRIPCISRYTQGQILKKIKLNNTSVINLGIDPDKFHRARQNSREKFLISVGALKYRKGYHISIPAFALVKKEISDLKYKIVGSQKDKKYFAHLKDLTRKYGIEKDVDFLMNVSDNKLGDIYSQAKLFILTSVNHGYHFEGFGLVFLEAAAAGLPVIGTLDNGIEDAVKDGYNGILVPQNNVEKTADAIVNILSEPEKWQKMSQESYKWAEEHDISLTINKYLSLYKQL